VSSAERVAASRRVERYFGSGDLPNSFRKPFGNGWALVGDAGCHKDPVLALGICDAFRDAELLSAAVDRGLGGERPMTAALADYESERNAMTMAAYRENLQFAAFGDPPSDLLRLRHALRGDAAETRRYYLARQGRIPPATFFNPENIERLLSRQVLAAYR
jgi:2-polyprenyl-6-methoxyphenol hydroxylase-like FAD-dependent oxidoreductase